MQVADIITTIDADQKKSVVVSAMTGTTDLLLQAGKYAIEEKFSEAKKCIQK